MNAPYRRTALVLVACIPSVWLAACDHEAPATRFAADTGVDIVEQGSDVRTYLRDSGPVAAEPEPVEPAVAGGSCLGYASCLTSVSTECWSTQGCEWTNGDCTGVASSCYAKSSSYSCDEQDGCYWSSYYDDCTGSARWCSFYDSHYGCTGQDGCWWEEPECTGLATGCSTYSYQYTCEAQPGCSWHSDG